MLRIDIALHHRFPRRTAADDVLMMMMTKKTITNEDDNDFDVDENLTY